MELSWNAGCRLMSSKEIYVRARDCGIVKAKSGLSFVINILYQINKLLTIVLTCFEITVILMLYVYLKRTS